MCPAWATTLVGALLVDFAGESFFSITLGTFLVGVGWAAANVAATALVADRYELTPSSAAAPSAWPTASPAPWAVAGRARDRSVDRLERPAGGRPGGGADRGRFRLPCGR